MRRVIGFRWRCVRGMTGDVAGGKAVVCDRIGPGGRRRLWARWMHIKWWRENRLKRNLFEPEVVALNCNHRNLARFCREFHVCEGNMT